VQLSEHVNQPRKLCRSLSVLLGKNTARTPSPNCPSAQQVLDHFIEKVASVRRSTGGSEASTIQPPTTTRFDQFVACSAEGIRKVITAAPAKSCGLDPVQCRSSQNVPTRTTSVYHSHVHGWKISYFRNYPNIKNIKIFFDIFDIFDIFQKIKISNKLYNSGCT